MEKLSRRKALLGLAAAGAGAAVIFAIPMISIQQKRSKP
jgi:hypothetical protein